MIDSQHRSTPLGPGGGGGGVENAFCLLMLFPYPTGGSKRGGRSSGSLRALYPRAGIYERWLSKDGFLHAAGKWKDSFRVSSTGTFPQPLALATGTQIDVVIILVCACGWVAARAAGPRHVIRRGSLGMQVILHPHPPARSSFPS